MRWHTVDIPQAAKSFWFPEDICCNCGTRDDVDVINTDVRRTVYLLVAGFEEKLRVALPFCKSCAITAEMRPPGVAAKVVWWMVWTFFLWCAVMGLCVWMGVRVNPGYFMLGIALGMVVLMTLWFRRRPRGKRTSNYQPVRFLGGSAKLFGPSSPGTTWAFSNPEYATLVAERSKVGVLPEARVVKT